MPKDSFYFPHDYNARNDERILELRAAHGAEGYGLFWMIIETMAENENGGVKANLIGGLSLGYGVAKGTLSAVIKTCIDLELFQEEGDYLFSKRLLSHKNMRKSLSINGSEGAKKRWGSNSGANSDPNAKERKGKEKKEKEKKVGVSFSEDKKEVLFADGSRQRLGMSQEQRIKEGNYQPHYITQGVIE